MGRPTPGPRPRRTSRGTRPTRSRAWRRSPASSPSTTTRATARPAAPVTTATSSSRRTAHRRPTPRRIRPGMAETRWVYDFADGSREMRELLGGKGANVAEMTRVLGPERVPAGFTITTEACVAYMKAGQEEPEGMAEEVAAALGRLEEQAGKN